MLGIAGVFLLLALIGGVAAWWHYARGHTLYYGDAQAHWAIARRIVDSRTPGLDQIGTAWLPLPHLLLLPFVKDSHWWQTGLGAIFPSVFCFVTAGGFLFAAVRRALDSTTAAITATLLFALNPNLLYLQATPMTEPVLLAGLMALFYATVWFGQTGSWLALLLAAAASNAASLTRYEGWFLIPFVTLFVLVRAKKHRWAKALLFGTLASLGPLAWLAHNWWHYGNFLEFYNGPYSALGYYRKSLAQGMARYPGDHDWLQAIYQFSAAARLCAGWGLTLAGAAGTVALLWKRAWWTAAFLALPVLFYVLSIYSSGTPIFVPHLWPNSYYNTRYGLAAFPFLVVAAAAWTAVAPQRIRPLVLIACVLAGVAPWIGYPRPEGWICWKESQVNEDGRRQVTRLAAEFLKNNYRKGDGIFSGGNVMSIFREAGIPLKEVLHEGNQPHWEAAKARPELFLWEQWALGISGEDVPTALLKMDRRSTRYECVKMIIIKNAPVIEIYRRIHENPIHESTRREE